MRTLQGLVCCQSLYCLWQYMHKRQRVKRGCMTPASAWQYYPQYLQEHDNPFTLYPYDTNYIIYTQTSDLNKEAIASYDWAENARKDEVKFQLEPGVPLWRGILGPNSVLGASTHKIVVVASISDDESCRFVKLTTNGSCSSGFATDYNFCWLEFCDVEIGYNHDSNGRFADPTSHSWNRLYTRLMAKTVTCW